jgi:glyoxylase-like metal-dependent hydrolase (beta-lactamase superfamily II)
MLRHLFKFAGLLLFAGIALIAVFLVRAHWQIRQVQTPLPSEGTVREMLSGQDGPNRIRIINTASQRIPDTGSLAYPAFVVEWPDGRTLLIDVGMEPEGAIEFGRAIETLLGADAAVPYGSVGDQLSDEVTGLAGIAFTHLHEDHVGGLGSVCRSAGNSIPIFQTPLQTDKQNYTTDLGHRLISDTSCVTRSRLQGSGPLYSIPDFPGLLAYAAGGHTPGSTVFFVKIGNTIWVLAGDITNDKRSIDKNLPKPMLYSLLVTPEATGRLPDLRLWLGRLDDKSDITVVVSHDLAALKRLPILMMNTES